MSLSSNWGQTLYDLNRRIIVFEQLLNVHKNLINPDAMRLSDRLLHLGQTVTHNNHAATDSASPVGKLSVS